MASRISRAGYSNPSNVGFDTVRSSSVRPSSRFSATSALNLFGVSRNGVRDENTHASHVRRLIASVGSLDKDLVEAIFGEPVLPETPLVGEGKQSAAGLERLEGEDLHDRSSDLCGIRRPVGRLHERHILGVFDRDRYLPEEAGLRIPCKADVKYMLVENSKRLCHLHLAPSWAMCAN